MESDGFNLQNLQLLVDNNAETMDEREDNPLDEDIASLFTPEMISSLLAQNASALDDASSVEWSSLYAFKNWVYCVSIVIVILISSQMLQLLSDLNVAI